LARLATLVLFSIIRLESRQWVEPICMRAPIFVRPMSDAERKQLGGGLRSSESLVLRRCQILLANSRGEWAPHIARQLCCDDQTVRNAIRAFNTVGLACLIQGSRRSHTTGAAFQGKAADRLRSLVHRSPRTFGKPTSLWTLELAAEVSFERGLTRQRVTGETIRATLVRLGVRWQQAKQSTCGGPAPTRRMPEKRARDRLIRLVEQHPDWVLGFEDEVWWSRFAACLDRSWSAHASGGTVGPQE